MSISKRVVTLLAAILLIMGIFQFVFNLFHFAGDTRLHAESIIDFLTLIIAFPLIIYGMDWALRNINFDDWFKW